MNDAAALLALRGALGVDATIGLDGNMGFTETAAVALLNAAVDRGLANAEELVPSLHGIGRLAGLSGVPASTHWLSVGLQKEL